jgi:hypothetical protein
MMPKLLLPIGTALAVVLATGLLHGRWTQRWQSSSALATAAAQLDGVPLTLDDWHGQVLDIDADAIADAGLAAGWRRQYVHGRDGAAVTVVLLCGRSGPTSVHTPEWCYGGAGYEPADAPKRFQFDAQGEAAPATFWTARFIKQQTAVPDQLRIFWSWYADGAWQTPDYPRLTFRRLPVLHKLYVVRTLGAGREEIENDPCVRFLRDVLPILGQSLDPFEPAR